MIYNSIRVVLLTELEYFNQIKNVIENYEVSNKVRLMQDNLQ